jgi:hypothetical protein
MANLSKSTRVPVTFSVVCYEEQHHKLPGGQSLDIPRHWRLVAPDKKVMGSGPYESEGVVLALIRMAGEYMREHPHDARQIMVDTHHTRVRVPLPDLEVGSDAWWSAKEAADKNKRSLIQPAQSGE